MSGATEASVAPSALPREGDGQLGERVYQTLLDMILQRKLPSGSVLQERRIAESLGVSRTPVREALNRLETEGMASRDAGRILVVRGLSTREVIEALNVRRILEGEAAALAAGRIPAAELDAAESAIARLVAKDAPGVEEHRAIDDMLHGAIATHSGNALLARMIGDLRLKTYMFNLERIPERFRKGHQEHLDIIAALRAGKRGRARAMVEAHVENVKKSIIAMLSAI
ncbi:GntR family transcriptional regulator [Aureimonas populi]|uniref:GntR family transcriptional regulator n=1 Tax=Aureimonas populi TaxID=1701758 RepID=A0ABW5CR58_9HYPH|nr:GntR family transcriptional regulator [Aureimonas populi]